MNQPATSLLHAVASMDDTLRTTALTVRAAMPCSIELPAGTGKTHIVAALAAVASERGERVLVLTHTNAGIDVLRRRLRQFGISNASARVDTIARWSFDLVRHYPMLSGVAAEVEPDWTRSREYYEGAADAVRRAAIQSVLHASYDLVIVDEYQDCVIEQHSLVLALSESLPVCVFGDPLQNIFSFGDNVTVNWGTDVAATWPGLALPVHPWRWASHNDTLGRWLIDIRDNLRSGSPIDLRGAPLTWRVSEATQASSIRACYAQSNASGSVVVIGQRSQDCAFIAARTNGVYGMMEELEGKLMMSFAAVVDSNDLNRIASATLEFAKSCMSGVAAKLNADVAKKLSQAKPVAQLKRVGAERQLQLLTGLLSDAQPGQILETLMAIRKLEGTRLYRREAWRDMISALNVVAAESEVTVTQAVARIRNRTRVIGRAIESRVVSRPLLIKGLEYDHAIVLNAERFTATELYVALSRARRSLTVLSPRRFLGPAMPQI